MSAEDHAGLVLGSEDSTPLDFWVAVDPESCLQLDDVVALERTPPGRGPIKIFGVVSQVRARFEGPRFDSDVFLVDRGILSADVVEAAQVLATRFEPEVFVPPLPGAPVRKARGAERDQALFFDGMRAKLPIGLSHDDEPVFANLEFVDGTRGAHVNISGISGVATKTTYATFLLHSLFTSGALEGEAVNTKALIFNVKGEDLLFLDRDNIDLDAEEAARYKLLGLPAGAFASVSFYAPPRVGSAAATPDVASRATGVTSFFWTLAEFCESALLPFLFADAEDDRQQYTMIVHNVAARLKREATPLPDGGVAIDGFELNTFPALVDFLVMKLEDEMFSADWAGRAIGQGTINAFIRRLAGSVRHVERLIRGDVSNPDRHRVAMQSQVTVVDLHNLNDRAKRFVVGVTLKRAFDEKERSGRARPLLFVVLDELNKYAPRDGSSPIKEILLDIAERGRSLGVIMIGAQQTASEVERRLIANAAIRVVGRLDGAESGRDEYRFLPAPTRQRATIIKPGTMIVNQPELPVPLVIEFPFPAWATRASEAAASSDGPEDPFDGIPAQ
jgi:DNA helicase HerA-like ATPase